MAALLPTIEQLTQELITRAAGLPAFKDKSFSIFDMDDLEAKIAGSGTELPMAGVGYMGCAPAGNVVEPVARLSTAVGLVDMQFMIVVAIQYGYTGADDTKPQATNLLDQMRQQIHGYKQVNSRPWRFIGERPEPEASGDGVAFYSQVWRTAVVSQGSFVNP